MATRDRRPLEGARCNVRTPARGRFSYNMPPGVLQVNSRQAVSRAGFSYLVPRGCSRRGGSLRSRGLGLGIGGLRGLPVFAVSRQQFMKHPGKSPRLPPQTFMDLAFVLPRQVGALVIFHQTSPARGQAGRWHDLSLPCPRRPSPDMWTRQIHRKRTGA
jgi:hypothetical protein